MNIFGKLAEIALKTVTLPIDATLDVVTLGGLLSENEGSYTVKKCKDIMEDIDELGD